MSSDFLGFARWRRRRDSNPRYALTAYNGLANRRLQPLGHVSVWAGQALSTAIASNKAGIGTQLAPEYSDHWFDHNDHRSRVVLIAASIAVAAAASVFRNRCP
jgi:hypothetical protein